MKKIVIDKNKCIGCHKCKRTCYSVFEIDTDGKAKVRQRISNADIKDAKTAVINCPTGAIDIVETRNKGKNIFIGLIIIVIVFYGTQLLQWGIDTTLKGDEYIASTKYNDYVINIANEHVNKEIFDFTGDPITSPTDDNVIMRYTFKQAMSKEQYEQCAYEEVSYVYNAVKDQKIKKDEFLLRQVKTCISSSI